MARAIVLSEMGLGKTSPNPIVGALILDSAGSIVGEGFHDRMNCADHAEIIALKAAGEKARGATMLITLEPCNHLGATPPCSQAIINAGITQVIYAVNDPHKVASGGAQALRGAGILVKAGVLEDEAAFANRAWLMKIAKNRPFFTWKIAATLDGKSAASDSTSQWITNEASRSDVQLLRRAADAILVGTNTVLTDNPHLVPRGEFHGFTRNPLRVICGEQKLPSGSNIFDAAAPTLIVASKSLNLLVEKLNEAGVNHVLIESGPTLASAMLAAGLVDELIIYQAPSILGSGRAFVADFGATNINQRMIMKHVNTEILDGDVKSRYTIRNGA